MRAINERSDLPLKWAKELTLFPPQNTTIPKIGIHFPSQRKDSLSEEGSSYESAPSSPSSNESHRPQAPTPRRNGSSNTFETPVKPISPTSLTKKKFVDFSQQVDLEMTSNSHHGVEQLKPSTSSQKSKIQYVSNSSWDIESNQSFLPNFKPIQETYSPSWSLDSVASTSSLGGRSSNTDENRIQTVDSEALSRALTSRWSVSTGDLKSEGSETEDEEETIDDRGESRFTSSDRLRMSSQTRNDSISVDGDQREVDYFGTQKNSTNTLRGGSSSINQMSRDDHSISAPTVGMIVSPMESTAFLKGSDSIYSGPTSPNQASSSTTTTTSKSSSSYQSSSFSTSSHHIMTLSPDLDLKERQEELDRKVEERRERSSSISTDHSVFSSMTSPGEYGHNAVSRWKDPDFHRASNRQILPNLVMKGKEKEKGASKFRGNLDGEEGGGEEEQNRKTSSDSYSSGGSNHTEIQSQRARSRNFDSSFISPASSNDTDADGDSRIIDVDDLDLRSDSSSILEVEYDDLSLSENENEESESDLELSNLRSKLCRARSPGITKPQLNEDDELFSETSRSTSPRRSQSQMEFQFPTRVASSPTISERSNRSDIPTPRSPHRPHLDLFPSPISPNFDGKVKEHRTRSYDHQPSTSVNHRTSSPGLDVDLRPFASSHSHSFSFEPVIKFASTPKSSGFQSQVSSMTPSHRTMGTSLTFRFSSSPLRISQRRPPKVLLISQLIKVSLYLRVPSSSSSLFISTSNCRSIGRALAFLLLDSERLPVSEPKPSSLKYTRLGSIIQSPVYRSPCRASPSSQLSF